jgi:hypothetical protein
MEKTGKSRPVRPVSSVSKLEYVKGREFAEFIF